MYHVCVRLHGASNETKRMDIMANTKRNTTDARLVRKPATATATRKPGRVTKPATGATIPTFTNTADVMAFAANVTPDNFGAMLTAANTGHGVTHGGRNTNRFNGTRIEYTQNETFVRNVTAQLNDVQLLWTWAVCFPMATGRVFDVNRATDDASMRNAIIAGVGIVRGARRTFNAGKHGCPAPASPSVVYGDRRVTFTTPTPTPNA